MIVLSTNGKTGISRLLRSSRAQRLAREAKLLTLFVPEGGRYFVSDEISADAIYMSTTWSKAGFGRVEGGVTERVLAGALCPVAAVPVDRGIPA